MKKLTLTSVAVLSALVSFNSFAGTKVIYGEDNRKDLYESTNALELDLAESTAALISTHDIRAEADGFRLPSTTFRESFGMCASERFIDQPNPANCSGTLVGKDLLLTAGHCIDQSDCADYKFVFGFNVKKAGVFPTKIAANDVVGCKEIVGWGLNGNGADFAVVRLDREITHRKPVAINRANDLKVGDKVTVIGHPSGLPTKITDGGKVRSVNHNGYFMANTDTYGGNSGSGVFNSLTGKLEGILVRGEQDYIFSGGCRASNRVSEDGGRGEDITKVSEAAAFIPEI